MTFKTLFILSLFLLSQQAFSACSSLVGKATINEVSVVSGNYIEVVRLDPSVSISGWKLYVCDGNNANSCETLTTPINTKTDLLTGRTYYTYQISSGNLSKLQVVLLDTLSDPIDFVNATGGANYSLITTALKSCNSFLYDTTATPDASNKLIFRGPDGTGEWYVDPSTGSTSNYTNTATNNTNPLCTIPDYVLRKSVNNSTPGIGDTILYTLSILNTGCTPATNATLTDILPSPYLQYVSSTYSTGISQVNNSNWTVTPLAYGVTKNVTISAKVLSGIGKTVTNSGSVPIANDLTPADNNSSINIFPACITRNYTGATTPIEFEGGSVVLTNTYNVKKWDHVTFTTPFNTVPVVFAVIDSNGGDPASIGIKNITQTGFDVAIIEPQGEDGPHISQTLSWFAINKGVHKLGNDYIEVNAIDTKKAQGKNLPAGSDAGWATITPAVEYCDPAVVSNIQTMRNEQNNPPTNTSKPWMTSVLDINESGIFTALDMSETDAGLISQNETIGYMIAKPNYKDAFADDTGKSIAYETIKTTPYFLGWDNSCKTVNFANTFTKTPLIAGWKNSRIESDGGWFRICSLNNTTIGFKVDEDQAKDNERSHVAESGSVFAFSDTFSLHKTAVVNYNFDAWDTFRSISDRNISTKIVSKDFNLTIASLNDTNTGLKDFNGTVCAQIVNTAGTAISGWSAAAIFNNEQTKTLGFNLSRAIGGSDSAAIKLYWKKNISSACPISTEDNSTIASDRFAVRPASFDLSALNAVAGADFNVTFRGLSQIGTASSDYNETSGGTFDVQIAERNPACPLGTFTVPLTPFTFQNGSKTLTTRYSDVGLLDINITDRAKPCASRYAAVDCDDLNVSDGSAFTADLMPIGLKSTSIVIKPHHFEYDARLQNFNALNYTYLSNDLNMSAKLDLNVTAKGADNLTTRNYNALCYAKNTNYTFNYSTTPSISSALQYVTDRPDPYTQVFGAGTFAINDMNRSVFSTDHNGTAAFVVSVNFTRNAALPLSPFDLNISSALVQDTDGINGNDTIIGNATFVYGRTRAYDITTDQTTVPNPVEIEIYGKNSAHSFLNAKPQNILYWYRNTDHDSNATGSILSAVATGLVFNTSTSPLNGLHAITITNPLGAAMTRSVNLSIPQWLWYSPSGIAYDGSGTDCSKHPCFEYRFIPGLSTTDELRQNTKGVNSGTFGGSDFSIPSNNAETSRGSKIFR